MPILATRAVAATVSAALTRVRDMVADPGGPNTVPRWSDAQIYRALDDMLREMHMQVTSANGAGFETATSLTYPSGSQSVALANDIAPQSIYRVEDATNANNPLPLDYIDPFDANRFSGKYGWALIGQAIAIRPVGGASMTLNIWTIPNFIPVSTSGAPTTDQVPISANHEELLALGAAIRLQEIDDEVPPSRISRFERLWEAFKQSSEAMKGPSYVRSTRNFA